MDNYLKAAGKNSNHALSSIGHRFLNEQGVTSNKYKALEWFIKYGRKPEQVETLNEQRFHLKEEDKEKTVYQLIIEAENLIREERKKKVKEYQQLEKLEFLDGKELTKCQKEIKQKLNRIDALENIVRQNMNDSKLSAQSNNTLNQQLKYKENTINSLKREIEAPKKESELFELLA